jgi:hypothetical protein
MVAGSVMRLRMSSTSMASDSEPLGRQSSAALATGSARARLVTRLITPTGVVKPW